MDPLFGMPDLGEREVELGDPPAEGLAERDRRRVLQMGPADRDDLVELAGLRCEGVAQRLDRRGEPLA